ncbi:hypothetical protein AciPR4_2232 [Terriglobus saanensis SP1PR4]|uniref:Xylose isomerase domain-containing protein TIM barrel n=1 Tax=Terriglobus saanensis (strain ATCC BAA-1853 / DSM 23119 / SP1PR4) TaxID=401053 RepID=E8UX71_TERSS|nr:hypothetical protein AciPR4_2232 [Terriglobus saanensis SP1PR4]
MTYGNVSDLPAFSTGPQGSDVQLHREIAQAGYEGLQGGHPGLCSKFGLALLGSGLLVQPADADELAASWKARDAVAVTCIAGFGMESDTEMDVYAAAICKAAVDHQIPLMLETHRASITQDAWRTVQLSRRFPQLRFNLDLSHWYTGQEMLYGDLSARLSFLKPIFEQTLFLHGRIGDRCCMQVPLAEVSEVGLSIFRRAWTQVMRHLLLSSHEADMELWFCPELLGPTYNYARQFHDDAGELQEETDRWQEAQLLVAIAQDCFKDACSSLKGGDRFSTPTCSITDKVVDNEHKINQKGNTSCKS